MHKTSRRSLLKTTAIASAAIAGGFAGSLQNAQAQQSSGCKAGPVRFKLGLASYTLRKFSLEDAIKMTQRVGLEYICLKSFHLPLDADDEQCRRVAEQIANAGLKLYGGGVIYMGKPDQVENAFRYAKAAGMKTIVGVPAPELLPLVEKLVKQYDIAVAIHNHGPTDKVYPTPDVAYEKIKNLDPRIGLCVDIGHTVRAGANLVEIIRQCADRILDIHAKDVSEATRQGRCVEMGRGVIDIPAFYRTLIEIGYDKIVAFEYEKDAGDPLPGLAETVGYSRGVLEVIGS